MVYYKSSKETGNREEAEMDEETKEKLQRLVWDVLVGVISGLIVAMLTS